MQQEQLCGCLKVWYDLLKVNTEFIMLNMSILTKHFVFNNQNDYSQAR